MHNRASLADPTTLRRQQWTTQKNDEFNETNGLWTAFMHVKQAKADILTPIEAVCFSLFWCFMICSATGAIMNARLILVFVIRVWRKSAETVYCNYFMQVFYMSFYFVAIRKKRDAKHIQVLF